MAGSGASEPGPHGAVPLRRRRPPHQLQLAAGCSDRSLATGSSERGAPVGGQNVGAARAARLAGRQVQAPTVKRVRDETIAVHGGYEAGPTRSVAVPIHQTVAHDFIDAAHAGAIFDLETPGFHYNRINNPTVDVLERRMAALEHGAVRGRSVLGCGAVRCSVRNLTEVGTQYRLGPAALRRHLHLFRPRATPGRRGGAFFGRRPGTSPSSRSSTTAQGPCFCESIGNPACNVVDIEAVAEGRPPPRRAADSGQHGRHAADAEAGRLRCRRRDPLAHQVRGRPRHDPRRHRHRRRDVPMGRARRAFPDVQRARAGVPRGGLREGLPDERLHRQVPHRGPPQRRGGALAPSTLSCSSRAWRPWPSGSSASRRTPVSWPSTLLATAASAGCATWVLPMTPTTSSPSGTWAAGTPRY